MAVLAAWAFRAVSLLTFALSFLVVATVAVAAAVPQALPLRHTNPNCGTTKKRNKKVLVTLFG